MPDNAASGKSAHMEALSASAGPLYEKVKEYVLANIGSGKWNQRYRLPSENELVSALGVSRMTVHRALRELTSEGYLLRIQGVGTFVAPPRPQSALIEIKNIASEIRQRNSRHRASVIVLEAVQSSAELTVAFEADQSIPIGHSLIVHYENDVPVQLEERFVNAELAPDYEKQDFEAITTYDYLQQKTPLTEVEHIITAIPADEEMARLLRMQPGDPCLMLHRRTWSGPTVATVNKLVYAGGRYSLGSRYAPSSVN